MDDRHHAVRLFHHTPADRSDQKTPKCTPTVTSHDDHPGILGRVDERVRGGLVKVTNGQLEAGPVAIVMSADPIDGAKLDVGAVMASEADAKTLESFAKTQLGLLSMAAQAKSLGMVVQKITVTTENEVVRFKANLDMNDVNLLISVLDGTAPAEESLPPPDAGIAPDAK